MNCRNTKSTEKNKYLTLVNVLSSVKQTHRVKRGVHPSPRVPFRNSAAKVREADSLIHTDARPIRDTDRS